MSTASLVAPYVLVGALTAFSVMGSSVGLP